MSPQHCVRTSLQRAAIFTSGAQSYLKRPTRHGSPPLAPLLQHTLLQQGSRAIRCAALTPLYAIASPAEQRRSGRQVSASLRCAVGVLHVVHCQRAGTRCHALQPSRCEAAAQADPAPYEILREEHHAELEVKRSKFLATAWPISNPEEALGRVASARDPGASHNCWAYRIAQDFRSSDDGEPGGTAGRPILAAIEGETLDAVCVLVTRHFGGVKLGTGGLVRAYGGAARLCLQQAPRTTITPKAQLQMEVQYTDIGTVYQLLDQHVVERLSEDYSTGTSAEVLITVKVEASAVQGLVEQTTNATSGRVKLHRV